VSAPYGGADPGSPDPGPSGPAASRPVLDVRELTKVYGEGEAAVHALRGVSAVVERGDYVAIMGSSGSGKSTLMHIVGCLDVPTSGRYLLDGVDVSSLNDRQLALVRNRRIGFVFQAFNLIARTTALANVELPLAYAGVKSAERRRRALAALDMVGLADRAEHEPNQLSGGQQQRVAVARALVTEPALLLADEPTGNLDSRSTADVLAIFDELNATGRTIMLITHEPEVGGRAKRLIKLFDGQISADVRQDARGWDGRAASPDQTTIQLERIR
jgi:putative ABC transport system ATP-binding protein